jgi:hypothetical protein
MNTRQIKPKQLWTPEGEKEATILALANFSNYHFDNGSGIVTYKLIGMEQSAIEYFTGSINIPSEIIQQWGESDDVIWNYISQSLNLEFNV